MKKCSILFVCLVPALFADQVVLKNGDTLTGSVVKKDGDKLTFKSEFLGEVNIPWSAVKSLKSDEDLTVVLPGGNMVAGKVSTSGDNLEVATGQGPRSAPLAAVDVLRNPTEQHHWERLQHPRLVQLWAGFFDLGLALARGNARTGTFTNSFNAARVTTNDKITLTFNQIYGTAEVNGVSATVASAVRGGWSYDRNVSSRLFVTTINDYEHDHFQNLNLRFVAGGGFGYNAIRSERASLAIVGGGDYERENFTNQLHRNSGEANFGDDFLYKFSSVTSLTQAFRMFPNITETGQYRMNFDLSGVTAIKKWLGWHLTASDRFLSNPVFGRQRNDLILSTGFRVSFAR
jgi:putative salt-induced outer membrane protein